MEIGTSASVAMMLSIDLNDIDQREQRMGGTTLGHVYR
jgi:hypothetical protein